MWALLVAAAWGFAEATLFFIVPDVALSAIAIADWRLALWCCLAATGGALVGGALVHQAARRDPGRLRLAFLRVPGIGPAMLERVAREVQDRRFLAVLSGPLSGTPYKLYAAESARQGLPLVGLLAVSVPARLPRFLAVTLLAAWLAHGAFPALPPVAQYGAWAGAWALFYIGYFRAMRRRG